MRAKLLLERLDRHAREYGPGAARTKLALLAALGDTSFSTTELLRVRDLLNYLRAYPDSPRLLRAAESAMHSLRAHLAKAPSRRRDQHGLPYTHNSHPFAHGMAMRLATGRRHGAVIDWDDWADDTPLLELLAQIAPGVEGQGVEDITLTHREWFARVLRGRPGDLALVLRLLAATPVGSQLRSHLFDACGIPIRISFAKSGTAIGEIRLHRRRPHFQRDVLDRARRPLAEEIRRTRLRVRRGSAAEGRRWVAAAQDELAARLLEIYPLSYANFADTHLAESDDGLEVYLFGVQPAYRASLECLYSFLVAKNGVPIAYGPATAFLGQSELGINLFPEFRGGEVGRCFGAVCATLQRVLRVDYFYLTRYGMGEGNEDAIRSGAFWFYRKLGFLPTNPVVEARAQREEQRLREDPSYRSSRATLRRLAETEAYLDLRGDNRTPLPFGAIGTALSRWIEERFAGDRERARSICSPRARRRLGIGPRARPNGSSTEEALDRLAPLLCLLEERQLLPAAERPQLARFVRGKGAPAEIAAARGSARMSCFEAALRQVAQS